MCAYIVDYSADYLHIDGVEDASYTDPSGVTDASVKVRRGNLTMGDMQGAFFGIAPGDVPFTVWPSTITTAVLAINGTLTVAGTIYTVVEIMATIPDGSQTRILCRKHR